MTPFRFRCSLSVLVSALFIAGSQAESPPAAEKNRFIRFTEDATGAALQTGIATYRNAAGVSVTLIGAVHVADAAYYDQLNTLFKEYDALLYEMVGGPIQQKIQREAEEKEETKAIEDAGSAADEAAAFPDAAEASAAQRMSWLHNLHGQLQKTLELEGQLDGIDYFQPNFVHADMTHAQFQHLQEQRNEGFLTLWLRAVQVQLQNPQATANQPGLLKILEILCRNDSATELKRLVGRSFDSVESIIAGMETGEGTVILSERNKVALAVMDQQIKLGKKKLAIFYGAAHLPDMEDRLLLMGFKKVSTSWLTGWNLPPEPAPQPAAPAAEN